MPLDRRFATESDELDRCEEPVEPGDTEAGDDEFLAVAIASTRILLDSLLASKRGDEAEADRLMKRYHRLAPRLKALTEQEEADD